MASADPKLQALLELERRGTLTPQASQMLSAYRAQGVSKTKPIGQSLKPGVNPQDTFETAKSRDDARKAMDLINRIQPSLDRVKSLYGQNLKGSGPLQSIREYIPSQKNAQFDAAVSMLRTLVRPATRTTGEGAMSDFESKLALQGVPDRWSFDGSNEESIRNLQTFLESSRSEYGKRIGLPSAPPRRPQSKTQGWSIEEAH